jgi:holo-[acyl-carrier protein] synthase
MSEPSPVSESAPEGRLLVGLGTDIVEIVRIGQMIQRHGERFLTRVYTDDEIRYCQRRKEAWPHFAGRWAAKEAVMKTLGTGFIKGVSFLDIEVCSQKSGRPVVTMHGGAREYSRLIGIDEILITISHCRAYATATAIAVRYAKLANGNGKSE